MGSTLSRVVIGTALCWVGACSVRSASGVVEYYSERQERVLEQAVRQKPHDVNALHILAWIYSTYDRYRFDKAKHALGLEYAQRAFSLAANEDIYMYEVLGAAMYANGDIAEGDHLFDHAIENSKDEKQRKDFSANKQKVRSIYYGREH